MKFYDLNIRGKNFVSDLKMVFEANRLGWNYINLIYPLDKYKSINFEKNYEKDLNEELNNVTEIAKVKNSIEIGFGVEIHGKNPNDLSKNVRKLRNKTKFILVSGGDEKINRTACESIKVDVLSRPYFRRSDSGINHVLAKEAAKNNVAIELCFKDVLSSYLSYRSKILSQFREIIKLHLKFEFPLILTTGASSILDIKSPKDIIAIFKYLGLKEDEVIRCLSDYPENIISFNNERDKMIVSGVKEIDIE